MASSLPEPHLFQSVPRYTVVAGDNKRVRYLLDEEEPKLFAILNGRRKHLRPLVTVAIGTGMRRGDQLNLLWEKVDFQRDVIYIPNSKTGKDYAVP